MQCDCRIKIKYNKKKKDFISSDLDISCLLSTLSSRVRYDPIINKTHWKSKSLTFQLVLRKGIS